MAIKSKKEKKEKKGSKGFGCGFGCGPVCGTGCGTGCCRKNKDEDKKRLLDDDKVTIEDKIDFIWEPETKMEKIRLELAETLREIELIKGHDTNGQDMLTILREKNDASRSLQILGEELIMLNDQLALIKSTIRLRDAETIKMQQELLQIETDERVKYDLCFEHVSKYSRDSNELVLEIISLENSYSQIRQQQEDLVTELNQLLMEQSISQNTSITIREKFESNISVIKEKTVKIDQDFKMFVKLLEQLKTKEELYEVERKETANMTKRVKQLKFQIQAEKDDHEKEMEKLRNMIPYNEKKIRDLEAALLARQSTVAEEINIDV